MKVGRFLSRFRLMGASLGAAFGFFMAGIVFWGGFNTAIEATNSLEYCIGCHEMERTVYREYQETVHYRNRSGVRASCPDCHVPRPWAHKVVRKIRATGDLFHKLAGTVDTPEKFEARRLDMAKRVWRSMKETDSRECRNCHSSEAMAAASQKPTAARQHKNAKTKGKTCIDCHKGIAHKDVSGQFNEEEER